MEISYVFCIQLLYMNVQLHIFVWILINFESTVYIYIVGVQRNLWGKFRNNFSLIHVIKYPPHGSSFVSPSTLRTVYFGRQEMNSIFRDQTGHTLHFYKTALSQKHVAK